MVYCLKLNFKIQEKLQVNQVNQIYISIKFNYLGAVEKSVGQLESEVQTESTHFSGSTENKLE